MAFSISPAPVRGPGLQTRNEFFTNKIIPLERNTLHNSLILMADTEGVGCEGPSGV